MKEFKFCGEMTEYVEIPVTVFETQKELLEQISGVIRDAKDLGMSEEESMYIIYKDGSKYFIYDEEEIGKFKRYGIKAAVYEHVNGYEVYGDFAVTDNGDISIEESNIEEYGVYAGQYDVKEQDEQEVQETETNETTDETETEETVKQAAEQETVESISKMEITTETGDSGFEYTRSQAQEIIMTGTSIAREKYREKHGIHSPMDLKKFSKKQLDDYLSKELDYINKFLNDTIPKEVFNAMKGEIMYA